MGNYPFKAVVIDEDNNTDSHTITPTSNNLHSISLMPKNIALHNIDSHSVNIISKELKTKNIIQSDINNIVQKKKNLHYEYIVFSGGGIKGISYCGALDILNKLDILGNIKGFAGTSAGSIVAALLAIGYTTDEITDIMTKLDLTEMVDGHTSYFREGLNLAQTYGMVPGSYVYDFLGSLIEKKTGFEDYTIQQLFDDKKIKLVIVATDMSTSQSRYFYPNSPVEFDSTIPIRKAIRTSISIPFLFEPILHLNNYHVDGGVLDNYPIHVFDGAYPGNLDAKNNLLRPNPSVLGFHITSAPQITKEIESQNIPEKVPNSADSTRVKIDSFMHFSMSFITAFMAENDRRELTMHNKMRTIQIITPYYPINCFAISDTDKNILIECGKHATHEFFKFHLENNREKSNI